MYSASPVTSIMLPTPYAGSLKELFREDGFDLNFEAMVARSQQQTDSDKAKEMVRDAFAFARDTIGAQPDESLFTPLPDGPIMAGAPRLAIVSAIVDHTAHHRGALAVYTYSTTNPAHALRSSRAIEQKKKSSHNPLETQIKKNICGVKRQQINGSIGGQRPASTTK